MKNYTKVICIKDYIDTNGISDRTLWSSKEITFKKGDTYIAIIDDVSSRIKSLESSSGTRKDVRIFTTDFKLIIYRTIESTDPYNIVNVIFPFYEYFSEKDAYRDSKISEILKEHE